MVNISESIVFDYSDITTNNHPNDTMGEWTSRCKVNSDKIYNHIFKINSKMKNKYNYIIMPISVFNVLEMDNRFSSRIDRKLEKGIRRVGDWCGFACYIDMYLSDEILLSWDKQLYRENKIDAILNGIDEKEITIKIIGI